MKPLAYVPTGVANTASVAAAFARLGYALAPVAEAAAVQRAPALLLPGVGQFGAAMAALQARGLAAALRERLQQGAPTLGICLGMQLCGTGSEESPGTPGLGALPAAASRFPAAVRCPQMGWNAVRAPHGARFLRDGHAYFANSYRFAAAPDGWLAATAEHGGPFAAALERGAVLLCQFHPELSGDYGDALLRRWLAAAEAAC